MAIKNEANERAVIANIVILWLLSESLPGLVGWRASGEKKTGGHVVDNIQLNVSHRLRLFTCPRDPIRKSD